MDRSRVYFYRFTTTAYNQLVIKPDNDQSDSAITAGGTYYFDDLTLSGGTGGGTEPTTAAPAPTRDAGDVISIFSDVYTDVTVDTWRTSWSAADYEEVTIAGNATKKYSNLDFVGVETVVSQVDASGMTHIHVDVWSPDFTEFGLKLVDFGPSGNSEHQVDFVSPNQGEWISYDIPLSDFTGLTNTTNIAQYIFVGRPIGASTIFLDNIYFYDDSSSGGGGTTGELAENGDFETGNLDGWAAYENGGTIIADNTESNGGDWSAKIVASPSGLNPTLKQERKGAGTITVGDTVQVTFDYKGSAASGGIYDIRSFVEATNGVNQTEIFSVTPTGTWQTFTTTYIVGAGDISGGITMQFGAICGGVTGCSSTLFLDNVSIIINP